MNQDQPSALTSPSTTTVVNYLKVNCDGGGGGLGHPQIYLEIKEAVAKIACPYCSKEFVYLKGDGLTS